MARDAGGHDGFKPPTIRTRPRLRFVRYDIKGLAMSVADPSLPGRT